MLFRPTRWDGLVDRVCRSLEGTPYRLNGCLKGLGVDCLHFAAAVLDELYGTAHGKDLKSLPPDACIHNKVGVMVAARQLFSKYPGMVRVRDLSLESGDLILMGRAGSINTTQHLLVAGCQGMLWHSDPPAVTSTGTGGLPNLRHVCSYRAVDKENWQCWP